LATEKQEMVLAQRTPPPAMKMFAIATIEGVNTPKRGAETAPLQLPTADYNIFKTNSSDGVFPGE
jgi:hypothetical protein